jgi:hypothetical protein
LVADAAVKTFDWGSIKWFVTPYAIQVASSSLGEVILNPGEAAPDYRLRDAGTVPTWEQGDA